MNAAAQQRILTALKDTTSRIPHIAADFGVSTTVVNWIADEHKIERRHRA